MLVPIFLWQATLQYLAVLHVGHDSRRPTLTPQLTHSSGTVGFYFEVLAVYLLRVLISGSSSESNWLKLVSEESNAELSGVFELDTTRDLKISYITVEVDSKGKSLHGDSTTVTAGSGNTPS